MGVATALRDAGWATRVVALEPAESPVLTTGSGGSHHLEGIGVGFVPPLLDADLVAETMAIAQQEAKETARWLASTHGIFAGWSSGLNVTAARRIARQLGEETTTVTVAVDSGLKYLDGELYA